MSSFPKAASAVAGAFIALLIAPAAFANIFGPDLVVAGQSLTTTVEVTVTLTAVYSTPKPGVAVTLTNCKSGQRAPIRLVRRFGNLGHLQAKPGKLVWSLDSIPAKPAKRKLRVRLAVPTGVKTFCFQTSMFDNFTKTTVTATNRVPI